MANAKDEDDYGCSEGFSLLASSQAPMVGDDGYYLEVTSPSKDDVAMAGEEYTIEVSGETQAIILLDGRREQWNLLHSTHIQFSSVVQEQYRCREKRR